MLYESRSICLSICLSFCLYGYGPMRGKEEWNGFSIRLTLFIESYFTASIHDEVIFGVLLDSTTVESHQFITSLFVTRYR